MNKSNFTTIKNAFTSLTNKPQDFNYKIQTFIKEALTIFDAQFSAISTLSQLKVIQLTQQP